MGVVPAACSCGCCPRRHLCRLPGSCVPTHHPAFRFAVDPLPQVRVCHATPVLRLASQAPVKMSQNLAGPAAAAAAEGSGSAAASAAASAQPAVSAAEEQRAAA